MKLLKLFLHCILAFFTKNFESQFNNLLGQDVIICDNVGWWSGFNKGVGIIQNINIGLGYIVKGMVTNNQVDLSRGALIGSSLIVVDGRRNTSVI